jgi:hypothetical protein
VTDRPDIPTITGTYRDAVGHIEDVLITVNANRRTWETIVLNGYRGVIISEELFAAMKEATER